VRVVALRWLLATCTGWLARVGWDCLKWSEI
jgi:hypothetical protein